MRKTLKELDNNNAERKPEKQKSYSTMINTSLRRAKRDDKTVVFAWIDYKKAYDMFCKAGSQNALDIRRCSLRKHEKLESGIDGWRKGLTEVKVQRGILQGDVL